MKVTKVILTMLIMLFLCTGCEKEKNIDSKEIVRNYGGKMWSKDILRVDMPLTKQVMTSENASYVVEEEEECGITVVGDSIMLGASEELLEVMPECDIDAKKSRQVAEGIEIIKNLEAEGELNDTVIIALGTNGTFTDEVVDELLECVGEERNIYWVTAYGKELSWQSEVNEQIRKLSREHENIYVLDWENIAKEHDEWFCEDGIHLNSNGQEGYARFISEYFVLKLSKFEKRACQIFPYHLCL